MFVNLQDLVPHFKLSRPLELNQINQSFGENKTSFYKSLGMKGHNGIDYKAPNGVPTFAVYPGLIHRVGVDSTGGKEVVLETDPKEVKGSLYKLQFIYYHLDSWEVKAGERVERGQLVAYTDNTGRYTTGAHLHFGMKVYKYVNGRWARDYNNGYFGAYDPEPLFTYMPEQHNPYGLKHHTLVQLTEGKGGFGLFTTDKDGNDRFYVDDLAKLQGVLLTKGTKTVNIDGEEFVVLVSKPIGIAQVAWDAYQPHYNLKGEKV